MKAFILPMLLLVSNVALADGFNVKLLANNKESYSRQIFRKDRRHIKNWLKHHSLTPSELKSRALSALNKSMNELKKRDAQCDLGLPKLISKNAIALNVIHGNEELPVFLAYLRENNLIDDIFYRILKDSNDVNNEMAERADDGRPLRPLNLYTSKNEHVDVAKMYSGVKTWPDEVKDCALSSYFRLTSAIKFKSPKDRDSQMHKLNYLALKQGIITLQTYHKLDVLQDKEVLEWPVNLNGYLEVLENAKDKLAKEIESSNANKFNEQYVSRKEKLTRRGRLYKVFSSTQVMMLSQLIEKTAKRMDARYVGLDFQFTADPKGERETYVLSPMEQYRVSIKMLRKDMGEIMRSETFKGTGLEYEDLITSAFETGLIKSAELDAILKFEDFWNPKTPKWKKYLNFAFNLAGTATFFLPPPWSIIGAVALIVTETKIMNDSKADSNDNWNAIL